MRVIFILGRAPKAGSDPVAVAAAVAARVCKNLRRSIGDQLSDFDPHPNTCDRDQVWCGKVGVVRKRCPVTAYSKVNRQHREESSKFRVGDHPYVNLFPDPGVVRSSAR